ncbi:NAD-dependent protein deacetylase hst2-1 [Penicillium taxi]|uniref:NAD-dependent protein deacetylase hst2-1 n=1 Tax=Penicillium taxi TaxID=168475 RepID=UPI002544FCEA|nr:NAD-dependent protein deacetylase hst2-1 [Penicillium taxi]KAJ5894474.1 NAD-dependent protein deacetylase hst2-1 [Penicillium taxi]
MGNEESVITDETPASTLDSRNMEAVAKYIKENNVKKIVLMVGAGISTSAGIPDFRSPDTGLYANLEFLDLEEPEDVFDIEFFRENPKPFYALARELYPGRYRPTVAHAFIKLLHDKKMLLKHFTQNIDCLERQAGVPGEYIIEAHGSFATQRCIDCKETYPDADMHEAVENGTVPHCPYCDGLVKPDIVFFGEALPDEFHANNWMPAQADLCIVMGTSLSVQPFASLPSIVRDGIPRVLINMERVGGLGSRADDVLILGDCDSGVRKFAQAMGWKEELEAIWEAIPDPKANKKEEKTLPPKTRDENFNEEMERLTKDVDRTLEISDAYEKRIRERLDLQTSQRSSSPNSFPEDKVAEVETSNDKVPEENLPEDKILDDGHLHEDIQR